MTAAIGRTLGNGGQVPAANLSKRGSWTVNSVDLPAKSVTTTKPNGLFQGQPDFRSIGSVLYVCHFNIEGLSRSKADCLSKILLHHKVDILALQETHVEDLENSARGNIAGYRLVAAVGHRAYGIATYVRQDIDGVSLAHKSCDDDIFVIAIKVSETTVVNVYKPPNIQWTDNVLPTFDQPAIYVGDFNSHHSQWGYSVDDHNGTGLVAWAEANNLSLVFDSKDASTFHSARWRRGYSPDLCFCSCDRSCKPIMAGRKVLSAFPHSQHRPVLVAVGIQIPLVRSFPRPRWNFNKANWEAFTSSLENNIRFIPPSAGNYDRFTKLIMSAAKKCIPRGFRKDYIPGWSQECEDLFDDFSTTGNPDTANLLLQNLDKARRDKWVKTVENLNFTHSSRKAWSLLRKLSTGKNINHPAVSQPKPSDVAKRIFSLSKLKRQSSDRYVNYELHDIKRSQQAQLEVSKDFTMEELEAAINTLSAGKAAGMDGIFPEFLKHVGPLMKTWLLAVFNEILLSGQLPKAFKKSKVIAVLKPGKEPDRAESYRPIALLSVCYKLLEKLLYARLSPILNPSIPAEQAGFRPGRNCCDQVLALTSFIEGGLDRNTKTSVAFLDLSAAYDTVWRKGLLYKFYNLVPCPVLLRLLNSMLSGRMFRVLLGKNESPIRRLKDGLPQGSVLAPLLFNVYTADLPQTQSRKFIYADDIALATQSKDLGRTEYTLTQDLETMKRYLDKWKLKPNPGKTEVACFHLNNKLANYKLNVNFGGVQLHHNEHPRYLGVTLDRTLTFKSHLEKTAAKLRSRANLIQHLAGSSWGANAQVLRISALSLVFSTAEYCAPVWLNSVHTKRVDVQLNRVMRTVSGTLMPTPLPWLPVLSHIPPPDIRRKEALIKEYNKILSTPDLPILQDLPHGRGRLKSRHPPLQTARQLKDNNFIPNSSWATSWDSFNGRNKFLIPNPTCGVGGMLLPRREWALLNRFRTDVGRCNSWKFKWGQVPDQSCDCGAETQTMHHIVNDCPLRALPGGVARLHRVDDTVLSWIRELDLAL
jgi:hypothetical protein